MKMSLAFKPFASFVGPIATAYYTPVASYPGSASPTRITVPAGATHMRMFVLAAAGGAGSYGTGYYSGSGGFSLATLAVTPGEQFDLFVPQGGAGGQGGNFGGYGGWPNGGHGTYNDTAGGGGGGRAEIRKVSSSASILIAGGGGGATGYAGHGGHGGGTSGESKTTAFGGTASAGGSMNGAKYQGGQYPSTYPFYEASNDCGGGGDGWYGGGTGVGDGQPGAGGSGYINPACIAGNTYLSTAVGTGLRPTQVPSSIYGFSTGTYGNGTPSVSSTTQGPKGNDGMIVIVFNNSNTFTQ